MKKYKQAHTHTQREREREREREIDLLVSSYRTLKNGKTKKIRAHKTCEFTLNENRYHIIALLIRTNGYGLCMHGRNIFRRETLISQNVRFDQTMIQGEDYDFFMSFLTKASFVGTAADIYSFEYRLAREGSVTNTESPERISSSLRVAAKWFDFFDGLKKEKTDEDIDFLAGEEANRYISLTTYAGRYKKEEMKKLISEFMKRPDILNRGQAKISRTIMKMYKIFGVPFTARLISIPWMKPLLTKIIMTLNEIKMKRARE